MKKIVFLFAIILLFSSVSCNKKSAENKEGKAQLPIASSFEGEVISTKDASRYTYIQYKTDDRRILWAAVLKTKLNKGDRIKLINPQVMKNFTSKTLNKTFDLIYFAEGVEINGKTKGENRGKMPEDGFHGGKNPHINQDIAKVDTSGIKKLKGGVSIKEIYDNPEKFKGKVIKLRAIVVKFLPSIMKKNWVHLKDASSEKDITATTDENFKVGEVVEIEGKLETKKDFGYGYFYDVLIENAKRLKK